MAELAEDGIHDHTSVRIVFSAEQFERAPRRRTRRRIACAHVDALDQCRQAERRALALGAFDREIAAQGFCDALDEGKAEAGTTIAPRHLRARLRERPEQHFYFGRTHADAAV